jgi:hypothetical protein
MYIKSFINHVEEETTKVHNNDITDFIDYGTKIMAYLSKNGIKNISVSN